MDEETFVSAPAQISIRKGHAHIILRSGNTNRRFCLTIHDFMASIELAQREIAEWTAKQRSPLVLRL